MVPFWDGVTRTQSRESSFQTYGLSFHPSPLWASTALPQPIPTTTRTLQEADVKYKEQWEVVLKDAGQQHQRKRNGKLHRRETRAYG